MSPKDLPSSKLRIVVLPLPLWPVWVLGHLAFRACRVVTRHVRDRRISTEPQSVDIANQHADGTCQQVAQQIYHNLNEFRKDQGLRRVAWNPRLEASSLYQSTRMAELGEFDHVLSDGVVLGDRVSRFGYAYRSCAENLFWVSDGRGLARDVARTMHTGWVRSPGHRENMVGDFREVGVGVVRDGEGGLFATQNFGSPRAPF